MSHSDSIWWVDDPWWERKVLPLGFMTLSFRQLGTLLLAFLAAFIVSLPFEFPIAGVSFGGRATVFCCIFGLGYVVANRRVKLLPAELQAFYYLLHTVQIERRKTGNRSYAKNGKGPVSIEMVVDDFKNPLPLVISDRVSGVEKKTKAQLVLDDQLRGEDLLTPQKARYRLLYLPLPQDEGKHQLCVKLDGLPEPLVAISLQLRGSKSSSQTDSSIVKVR